MFGTCRKTCFRANTLDKQACKMFVIPPRNKKWGFLPTQIVLFYATTTTKSTCRVTTPPPAPPCASSMRLALLARYCEKTATHGTGLWYIPRKLQDVSVEEQSPSPIRPPPARDPLKNIKPDPLRCWIVPITGQQRLFVTILPIQVQYDIILYYARRTRTVSRSIW